MTISSNASKPCPDPLSLELDLSGMPCPEGDLEVPGEGVHLWELIPRHSYAESLRPEEARRHTRMTNEDVQLSYATAQAGLRKIVARYTREDPASVEIRRGENGKPYRVGGPHFNLSHTAGRVFAAFSRTPVGLDVECTRRRVHADELAVKFFSESEREHLLSLRDPGKSVHFLRYWVCKEATVKLSGDGIYLGLRDAGVAWEADGSCRGTYCGREVFFRELRLAPDLMLALASWQPVEVKGFFRV